MHLGERDDGRLHARLLRWGGPIGPIGQGGDELAGAVGAVAVHDPCGVSVRFVRDAVVVGICRGEGQLGAAGTAHPGLEPDRLDLVGRPQQGRHHDALGVRVGGDIARQLAGQQQ